MRPRSTLPHETLEPASAARLEPLTARRARRLLLTRLTQLVPLASLTLGAGMQASGLDRDERVVLHATAAALDPSGRHWRVPIHVCVFEPEHDDAVRAAALAPLRRALAFQAGSPDAERFAMRTRLFLVDHERNQQVDVAIGSERFRVGPTRPSGHCEHTVDVPVELAASLTATSGPASGMGPLRLPLAIGAAGDPTGARGVVWLVPPQGLSVVSDIDDTIKVTGVGDRRATLANTFLREFRAVPGMAELYARLGASPVAEQGVAFHYVSLGPWQLSPLLGEFLAREGFPAGPLHLQPFRIQDGDLGDLIGDSRAKKLAAIEPLLSTWPQRRFVLIGDSGQLDPEVYGELARRHPEQVALVLIRDRPVAVDESTQPPGPDATPREAPREGDDAPRQVRWAARAAAAFAEVPAAKWQWFSDPALVELPAR